MEFEAKVERVEARVDAALEGGSAPAKGGTSDQASEKLDNLKQDNLEIESRKPLAS